LSIDSRFYDLPYDFEKGAGASEAERCLLCDCSLCIDACTMIRWFRQNPKRIAADLGVSVLPVAGKIKRVGSRMMNSCNLCGLCDSVCPFGIDTCAAIEASRNILKESGHMAPAYHDFWMEDFAFSMSDEAYGVVYGQQPPDTGKAQIMFFPGCQLPASLPDTVTRTFDFISDMEPSSAMLLSCCGVPAQWASEKEVFQETTERLREEWYKLGKPEVLFACSTCREVFSKALPEIKGRLVYEWIVEQVPRAGSTKRYVPVVRSCVPAPQTKAAVFDPCNSRGDSAGQSAVRKLAKDLGYSLEELKLSGKEAACCGFGGHIYPANPGLLEEILDERASEAPGLPRITYCANCRDLFLHDGIESAHILEIVFPDPEPGAESAKQNNKDLPTLSERRENRRAVKARYSKPGACADSSAGDPQAKVPDNISLNIPKEIEAKMDRLLLLRDDVARVIDYCEKENSKTIDKTTGRSIGYYRYRLVTVWAEYEIAEDGSAAVYNVYSHRMQIDD